LSGNIQAGLAPARSVCRNASADIGKQPYYAARQVNRARANAAAGATLFERDHSHLTFNIYHLSFTAFDLVKARVYLKVIDK